MSALSGLPIWFWIFIAPELIVTILWLAIGLPLSLIQGLVQYRRELHLARIRKDSM